MQLFKKRTILATVMTLVAFFMIAGPWAVPARAQTPSADLSTYVLIARDELNFKGGNEGTYVRGYVLGGNVGVNIADSTPNNSDALLAVGLNGLFVMSSGTQLVGDSIRLGVEAKVYDVYRNYELGVGWGATNPKLGGSTILGTKYTFTPPIINPWPTTESLCGAFDPVGTTDITVTTGSGGNSPLTLAPGAYEDIQVQNGATLRLQAGVYTVRTFNTGQNVNVYTVPGTVIHIWGDGDPNASDFNLGGNGSYFGSENPNVESVACICVSDALNNSGGTANNNAIQFSDNGEFWGVIYAPGSSINLGRAFTHYGRFVGRIIGSDFNDNVTYKDCTPAPPDEGTTLSANKTASGSFGTDFTWKINKSLNPNDGSLFDYLTLNLFKGDTQQVRFIVTAVKSKSTTATAYVDGQVCVTNTGSVATEGLAISDQVTDGSTVMGSTTVDVSLKPVLGARETYCYPYRVDFTNPAGANGTTTYTNTATVTIANFESGGPVTATATTLLTESAGGNASITVNDTNGGSWTFSATGNQVYEQTFTANADCGSHTNRATIVETGQYAEATVQVFCYDLQMEKTAVPDVDWTYGWTIDKSADQSSVVLSEGQTFLVNYSVKVSPSYAVSASVSGDIKVTNPAPMAALINSISDIITLGDIVPTLNCGVAFPYILAAGQTLTCTYSAVLPDANTRINTATATLQNYYTTFLGVKTSNGTTNFSATAGIGAVPPDKTGECVDVYDTNLITPNPNPGGFLGQVCDSAYTFTYKLLIGPYEVCGDDTVDNTASFTNIDTGATGSDSWTVSVSVPCNGCTLTPGYWKTHSEFGPAPYDDTWAQLPNGASTPFYLSGQTWYEVLWTPPAGGNAYYILAHAYIATYLNELNGAYVPPKVQEAMDQAVAFFSANMPTTVLTKKVRNDLVRVASLLDTYNNGLLKNGPPHCSEEPESCWY